MLDKMNNFLPNFAGLHLMPFLFLERVHSVEIQLVATAEKVTLNATVESNYHVLNGSTPLHLHPALPFFPQKLFGAKITFGNAQAALRWELCGAQERISNRRFLPVQMCCILIYDFFFLVQIIQNVCKNDLTRDVSKLTILNLF